MQQLFQKYLDNQCSPAEIAALLAYFNDHQQEHELRKLIQESLDKQNNITTEDEGYWNEITTKTYQQIKKQIDAEKATVVPFFKQTWFRVAAAVLLLVGAFAIYKLTGTKNKADQELAKVDTIKQDVAPGGNKAILKLADGTQIILDSVANGDIASQGKATIIKLDGQIAYKESSKVSPGGEDLEGAVAYNTISTPRGGQYQLILADGSKVWLNAASSLRFPANFTGKERKVELTGEGYFEVAKNAAVPFKVDVAGKGEVEVLGTHFNINSYADEPTINTTLLEGKVKVTGLVTGSSQFLTPGQQAQLSVNGQITINKNIDVDEVMAWKNGSFIFNSADIENIMRQVGRWYDVDVSFNGNISKELFSGIVSRSSNLSQVLKIMERAGVKFKIEGNPPAGRAGKIIVM